jgi:hypothetical protein
MAEKAENKPLTWDHDPYRGVDPTIMQRLLKSTPEERFWNAVASANNVAKLVEEARRTLRRK